MGQLSGLDPHCRYRFALRGLLPRIPRSAATGGMSRHDRTTPRMGVPGAAPGRIEISLVGERLPTLGYFDPRHFLQLLISAGSPGRQRWFQCLLV